MKEFTIGKNDAGPRLDRWLAKTLPLPAGPEVHPPQAGEGQWEGLPAGCAAPVGGHTPVIHQRRVLRAAQGGERLSERLQAPPGHLSLIHI